MSFFTTWFVVFLSDHLRSMSPGPDFVLTIRNSLVYSRRADLHGDWDRVGHVVHATYCSLELAQSSLAPFCCLTFKWGQPT